ncbi:MAG: U32 family peptidase [Rhodocyclaceae bacterium]|nr:U32 family peptidase [Rhodocyclaceae bacterium]
MPPPTQRLELLAPARNADFGIEAIRHGADAVYIGGPGFGARHGAGNPVEDIARLADFAHRFDAHVFVALNTILTDEELEPARQLAWECHRAGADALIVQDMGLLELDLPPIQLHASTQTDNRSADKVSFLSGVGFSQVVLARELTLDEIRTIAAQTDAVLEYFVHGALCVAYSGQCYISHAHTGRSANRGECSQACRLPYDLTDAAGEPVATGKHLLSMKDNDQSANLRALADAGVRSFKIEGRLKDLGYVKNVTAHYRQLLDRLISEAPGYQRASSGRCQYTFTPRPEKSFNRGATDYFAHGRQADIGAFDSPKYVGEPVGEVRRMGSGWLEVASEVPFTNGDGLSFYRPDGSLGGMRINRAEGTRLWPATAPEGLSEGMALYRNHDQAFERLMERPSAERRIAVDLRVLRQGQALQVELQDEDGHRVTVSQPYPPDDARDQERARDTLQRQLARFGESDFQLRGFSIELARCPFVQAATLNQMRREAVAALVAERNIARSVPMRSPARTPAPVYPQTELSYLGNVLNGAARRFYERHGVSLVADAYEANHEPGDVSLMITRHCLRFSFNLCPKQVKGIRPDPMQLVHGKDRLTLRFDCKRCEMHVVGALRPGVFEPAAVPLTLMRRPAKGEERA